MPNCMVETDGWYRTQSEVSEWYVIMNKSRTLIPASEKISNMPIYPVPDSSHYDESRVITQPPRCRQRQNNRSNFFPFLESMRTRKAKKTRTVLVRKQGAVYAL